MDHRRHYQHRSEEKINVILVIIPHEYKQATKQMRNGINFVCVKYDMVYNIR